LEQENQQYAKTASLLYETLGNSPSEWQRKAEELHYGAKLLWNCFLGASESLQQVISKYGVTSKRPALKETGAALTANNDFTLRLAQKNVATMLMGMALEAIIKAVLTLKKRRVTNQGKLEKALKKHSLSEFFGQAGIRLSTGERDQLNMFKKYVEWGGRYPVPTDDHRLCQERFADGSRPGHRVTNKTWDDFEALFGKAKDKFHVLISQSDMPQGAEG
jgi:hypothetical protein